MSDQKNLEMSSAKLNEVSGGEGTAQEPIDEETMKHLTPRKWPIEVDRPDKPAHLVAMEYGFPEPKFRRFYPKDRSKSSDDETNS